MNLEGLSIAQLSELERVPVDLYLERARNFTQNQRDKLANSGAAMKDGSYPIATVGDLRNAIQAIGRAKNPAAVKSHIKKRAAALGAGNLVPKDW